MVTPEERITRLEAIQEANTQQLALVLSRLDQVVNLIESVRQEAREMNEAARLEAREMNEATRQETRDEIRSLRQETHLLVDGARRDARNLFVAALTVTAGMGGGLIGLGIAILQRLPG